MTDREREELPLSKAALYLLEECRMVLPGMQALFGFQLIAVFSQPFDTKLTQLEQFLHLSALGLVAIGVALVMTPAAIHRQTGARQVTERFIEISTRLLLWSMIPLCIAICLDFFLIAHVISKSFNLAMLLSLLLLVVFTFLWFFFPRAQKKY